MPVVLKFDGKITAFTQWTFPGGEVGVKLLDSDPISQIQVIVHGIVTPEDTFVMLNLLDALSKKYEKKYYTELVIPYFPYARQDRVCTEGESFALAVFVNVLNTVRNKFNTLVTYDLHSEVSENYLSNIEGIKLINVHQSVLTRSLPEYDVIIAPDKGASVKVQFTQKNAVHVYLDKTRVNGKVEYRDYPLNSISGRVCIVDDICDGGATFIAAAKMLIGTQPGLDILDLYVTHGIFSKGLDDLQMYFDNIYTYNLMQHEHKEKVNVFS